MQALQLYLNSIGLHFNDSIVPPVLEDIGATTSMKPHGLHKTISIGFGPWSTNGMLFIASTRIFPKGLSKH
jgi:hypothetical protein